MEPPVLEPDALFTDLYELTMLQAYYEEGMTDEAVFDLSIRALPPRRNFLVACGLEQVLSYLEHLSFSPGSLEYLDSLRRFTPAFLDRLSRLRFTGNVRALPEGTVVFAGEPILEVIAPMPEAQLIETYVLNQVTFQTVIASKAARAVFAARGRTLVDFGSRRAHGSDAALKAARALYAAGYESTSNVLAGRLYGIPVAGTMAHSYVQAHDSERAAFEEFVRHFPETVLLVDTYDTEEGVRLAAAVALESGVRLRGVRLDSGDLLELAKRARRILDGAGLKDVGIFASGGLDEDEIARLLAGGAPIDAFGVGTAAVVSSDAPALDSVYKLVAYAGRPRLKLSPQKATLPGKKQVFRRFDDGGGMTGDVIALEDERGDGEPLLVEVMSSGQRSDAGRETLADVRARVAAQLEQLPDPLRALDPAPEPYRVALSPGLEQELRVLRAEHEARSP